ncbi:hypothetical protein [Burkholderia savannae]|uniref:gp53-like domain-containing protein n=1 Tax=Burkholderia savannae TaxID=1637837 RepID=UPI000A4BE2A4|nr:hypothetical protein [Burkholderia savannae]
MSKLVETSKWEEEIYQIEMSDPVEGGPDGISNRQAKQLGNRTLYLKQQIEQSQSGLSGHAAAADPHPQYATKVDLADRIAALVGQSPATLDTLNELANALGNDPNFATTMTNALSRKAPLDSPTFTGAPKGPTPAPFDSSTKMATTEFVQRALGNVNFASYTSSQKLTASQAGSCVNFWGGTASTFTLPSTSAMPLGGTFLFNNSSTAPLTITRDGTDTILLNGGNPSVTLASGDSLLLVAVPPTQWIAAGGSAQLPFASAMAGPNWTTPPQFDNSAKLATTAFVQRALGSYSGSAVINAATTLTSGNVGNIIELNGTSSFTTNLPAGASIAAGGKVAFVNQSGVDQTVATQGNDFIWSYATGKSSSIMLHSGDTLELFSRGGEWDICGGTVALRYVYGAATQTVPQFDSSPNIATTAFVQRALGNFQTIMVLDAATTLTPAQAGSAISLNDGASVVLPLYSAVKRGATFLFMNSGSMPKTISRQGGDIFFGPSGGSLSSTVTSFTLLPGDWALISAVYQWEMMAGSPLMTINNGAFEFSHGPTGYERSPTGKIEQWGQGVTDANGDINVVFPKRFPNACFNVAANHVGLGAAMVIVIHGSMTQDGVKLRAFNETGGTYPGWLVYWHATGK